MKNKLRNSSARKLASRRARNLHTLHSISERMVTALTNWRLTISFGGVR